MILTIEEAREALRIDGTDNDVIITPLLEAIPAYLEVSTGKAWDDDSTSSPLAKTAAKFILQLWYYPQNQEADRLKRAIDGLLVALTALARTTE
ncbi:MAG TPA: DNA packaging protein [Firmicutes bacterium]|nr:DNA packaging protein [Bacillota bacterium]